MAGSQWVKEDKDQLILVWLRNESERFSVGVKYNFVFCDFFLLINMSLLKAFVRSFFTLESCSNYQNGIRVIGLRALIIIIFENLLGGLN